ncbi:MAG: hypothetical protein A3G60_04000 [Candidatus Ryanbacteria bacterium RIFCSPLOWO2_12_FULL_47_9c]|uniref:Uncharacterized protein n=3 Tax=Parcubacteria group TaxID=1794811 RepID=A0A1G2H763_9BACT|nr:MAG: hypothetical protein UY02_C0020G0003 [Candidatus Giovannonibacteria bacterium GW2011_GWB1_47_6b]KKU86047.1 MAG: hypothetical protein UY14_C0008G0021 [Parcubacteria group bacterium GW2011_GWA1_47_9]OGZ55839.1 MAG: hypothetical protein A3J04_01455 [Candidatus Ryanbacteria bacterium RIFCSPLOWO2_02_FULL_47_14]OGZ58316.1 MAG: hypothetical protein A3G60_04000 [Candidatus Ryanbacteria bacterium RIFCSPLOWO2_12_FULL_47_9c]
MPVDNQLNITRFSWELQRTVKSLANAGMEREVLKVLAETLQHGLAIAYSRQRLPYSGSLEVLMRAVAALLSGDEEDLGSYIGEKLRVGIRSLLHELKDMPGFAGQWY